MLESHKSMGQWEEGREEKLEQNKGDQWFLRKMGQGQATVLNKVDKPH